MVMELREPPYTMPTHSQSAHTRFPHTLGPHSIPLRDRNFPVAVVLRASRLDAVLADRALDVSVVERSD